MYNSLFGQNLLDKTDCARIVIALARSNPAYELKRLFALNRQISVGVYTEDQKVSLWGRSGIYMIFRRKHEVTECLYVGATDHSVGDRLYRYMKELEDKSRPDENHPAAKKARLDGVKSTDNLYAHVVFKEDILNNLDPMYHYMYNTLDESVAEELNSRYNVKGKRRKCPTLLTNALSV